MTKGMAVLCMVVLHLFCRKGADVYGTPLLWINPNVPAVYWLGFYSEICVDVFSICAGYALFRNYSLSANWKDAYKSSVQRLKYLLLNYWIILCLFSLLGIAIRSQSMPGSFMLFIENFFLLKSYNGAWWYLNTYILLMFLSPLIILPVRKLSVKTGLIISFSFSVLWYALNRVGLLPSAAGGPVVSFLFKEAKNLIGILPSVWIGAEFCRGNILDKASEKLSEMNNHQLLIVGSWIVLFIMVNLAEKAVLTVFSAVLTFMLFNLWNKSRTAEMVFSLLGKHSTNIWLTHMFFYSGIFGGIVQKAVYPVFMLLFMMILCTATSYVVTVIQRQLVKIIG